MTCPQCGAEVTRVLQIDGACIEETVFSKGGLRRKVRPASYYACHTCEWCSEFPPPDGLRHDMRTGVISAVVDGEEVDDTELPDGKRCEICGSESCICGY